MMDSASRTQDWKFDLSGGRLCLDFVNTVGGMRGVTPKERLAVYPDLVEFARQAGAVDDARAHRLLAEARRRPAEAAAALRDAVKLREALYRLFLARAREEAPLDADVELVSAALGAALSHRRLERRGDALALGWDGSPALEAPLWPILTSAAELLASSGEAERVRVCGLFDTHECSWLFVDESRAGTRRWCSMKDCGNRAKARRHQQRVKSERA
jgi:predicted RNA-binding Zn ribbon-like protein